MKLLQKGNKERTQEPTAANKTSSRSHALLMVNVKQTAKSRAQTRGAVKFGRLYMIDLAGSERASQTEVFWRFFLCLVHVIWTERRMTNSVLNVCFDFFSRHEKKI